MGEIAANVIAGIALSFTAITWWIDKRRGKRNERRQAELDEAQAILKQRQLLLDEQMLIFAREIRRFADIRVELTRAWNTGPAYRLSVRNAGKGAAFDIKIEAEGDVELPFDWESVEQNSHVTINPLDGGQIERLDPESQPFISDFNALPAGFVGPVTLTVRWRNSGDHEHQTKRIRLTP